jgi:hypothetical protein
MSDEQLLNIYNHFLASFSTSIKSSALIAKHAANNAFYSTANPLNKFGAKIYSQNEEDGITFEILRRIGCLTGGTFAEFGVGNGTENNTLSLIALGWSGFWVGNQDLAFNTNPKAVEQCHFTYQKGWVKRDNIVDIYRSGLQSIRKEKCHVISLDLDGNDLYFIDELLDQGAQPDLFIAEYNAKFPPPVYFTIDYDEDHRWAADDYFGASLTALVALFEKHGYFLACCNVTGSNAFFVRNEHSALFSDVPEELALIYSSPKYFLTGLDPCGPPSIKTIESFFSKVNR